jgi:hypothetical protein
VPVSVLCANDFVAAVRTPHDSPATIVVYVTLHKVGADNATAAQRAFANTTHAVLAFVLLAIFHRNPLEAA